MVHSFSLASNYACSAFKISVCLGEKILANSGMLLSAWSIFQWFQWEYVSVLNVLNLHTTSHPQQISDNDCAIFWLQDTQGHHLLSCWVASFSFFFPFLIQGIGLQFSGNDEANSLMLFIEVSNWNFPIWPIIPIFFSIRFDWNCQRLCSIWRASLPNCRQLGQTISVFQVLCPLGLLKEILF